MKNIIIKRFEGQTTFACDSIWKHKKSDCYLLLYFLPSNLKLLLDFSEIYCSILSTLLFLFCFGKVVSDSFFRSFSYSWEIVSSLHCQKWMKSKNRNTWKVFLKLIFFSWHVCSYRKINYFYLLCLLIPKNSHINAIFFFNFLFMISERKAVL
jgi:hypothetical protein